MSYFNIILQNFRKVFLRNLKRYVVWCNRHAIPWNEIILALSFHLKAKILYPTLYTIQPSPTKIRPRPSLVIRIVFLIVANGNIDFCELHAIFYKRTHQSAKKVFQCFLLFKGSNCSYNNMLLYFLAADCSKS